MTHFKALYGRDPPTLLKFTEVQSVVEDVNQQMVERNALLEELKDNLQAAQNRMKASADTHRREVNFQPGDFVYLKLQPYRFVSLSKKVNAKLSPRFYGPYEVVQRIGAVAYKLTLPPSAKIHPVFHVSQLKKSLHSTVPVQPLPEFLTEDLELFNQLLF